jgi:hypothetical protein
MVLWVSSMVTDVEVQLAKPPYFGNAITKAIYKTAGIGMGLLTIGFGTKLVQITDRPEFTNFAMVTTTLTCLANLIMHAAISAEEKHEQDEHVALRTAYLQEQAIKQQLDEQKADILKQLGCQEATIDDKTQE